MAHCSSRSSSSSSISSVSGGIEGVASNFIDDKNASIFVLSSKNNTNTSNTNESSTTFVYGEDVSWPIFYDENLFRELNMHETVQNVYRSCFKESFEDNFSNLNQKKSGK